MPLTTQPDEAASTATVRANIRAELARQSRRHQDVARVIGLTPSALSRRLRGLTPFTVDEINRLATELGVPAAQFFGVAA